MYSNKSELRDKRTEVVDFSYPKGTFSYLGIEFQIYSDKNKRSTKAPQLALKRKDNNKRLSGLWQDGDLLRGDFRVDNKKRYFTLLISKDKKQLTLTGFREALSLIGITNQDTKTEGLKRLTEASTRDRKGYVDNPALKTAIEHI